MEQVKLMQHQLKELVVEQEEDLLQQDHPDQIQVEVDQVLVQADLHQQQTELLILEVVQVELDKDH